VSWLTHAQTQVCSNDNGLIDIPINLNLLNNLNILNGNAINA